jgi:hypothetical protein
LLYNTNIKAPASLPEKKKKHAGGRPTKYKPSYCQLLIKYFSIDPTIEREITHTNRKGETWSKSDIMGCEFPTFQGFCARVLKINRDTFYAWVKKYAEFSDSFARARDFQQEILISNALNGRYNPAFSMFAMKNISDWADKKEVAHSGAIDFKHFFEAMLERAEDIKEWDPIKQRSLGLVPSKN